MYFKNLGQGGVLGCGNKPPQSEELVSHLLAEENLLTEYRLGNDTKGYWEMAYFNPF